MKSNDGLIRLLLNAITLNGETSIFLPIADTAPGVFHLQLHTQVILLIKLRSNVGKSKFHEKHTAAGW